MCAHGSRPSGTFVLVHVATPLDVCERRDTKGLYARARAGQLTQFTGVSDAYEVPDDADFVVDTTHSDVDSDVDVLVKGLTARGYLVPRLAASTRS